MQIWILQLYKWWRPTTYKVHLAVRGAQQRARAYSCVLIPLVSQISRQIWYVNSVLSNFVTYARIVCLCRNKVCHNCYTHKFQSPWKFMKMMLLLKNPILFSPIHSVSPVFWGKSLKYHHGFSEKLLRGHKHFVHTDLLVWGRREVLSVLATYGWGPIGPSDVIVIVFNLRQCRLCIGVRLAPWPCNEQHKNGHMKEG